MYKIGIIGNGFVGSSISAGFGLHTKVLVYDVDPSRCLDTIQDVVACDFVFVSVPTPMDLGNDNKIDLSIIEEAFSTIVSNLEDTPDRKKIVVLKSTVIPGTTKFLKKKYPNLEIVFNPEFLTERNARLDFINTSRIVLGGAPEACREVAALYRVRFPHTPIISTDSVSAEFIKYMCNCFFATKISFINEMKQAVVSLGLNWGDIKNGFLLDGRVGNSHIDAPGHDGNHGFGGKCFPKDINAFINFFKDSGIDPKVLTAAWQKNLEVREDHDWVSIPGATSGGQSEKKT